MGIRSGFWKSKSGSLRADWVIPVALWACALVPALLGHLLELPELVRSFLALPLLVLIPLRLGRLGLRIIQHWLKGTPPVIDSLPGRVISWLLGVYLLTMAALLLPIRLKRAVLTSKPLSMAPASVRPMLATSGWE